MTSNTSFSVNSQLLQTAFTLCFSNLYKREFLASLTDSQYEVTLKRHKTDSHTINVCPKTFFQSKIAFNIKVSGHMAKQNEIGKLIR